MYMCCQMVGDRPKKKIFFVRVQSHHYSQNSEETMKLFSRVRVNFVSDAIVDFDGIFRDIQAEYQLGFVGLFTTEKGAAVMFQRQGTSKRMALGKVRKICSNFAEVVDVLPFEHLEGILIQSHGEFRIGRRESSSSPKNSDTRDSTGSQSNSEDNTTVYLHINALGEEDISHITKKVMEDLVGTKSDVIERFKSVLTPVGQENWKMRQWGIFRRFVRNRIRAWDKQEFAKDSGHQSACESLNINSRVESAEESDEEEYEEEGEISRQPIYDPDSDSEENRKFKENCLHLKMIDVNPEVFYENFLIEFEGQLYDSPHNSNVIASTKDGFFKYFDGHRWVKKKKSDFLEEVTTKRIDKAREAFKKLVSEGEMTEFAKEQVSSILETLVDFKQSLDIDNGVLAAENNELRLSQVAKSSGKRIVRLGSSSKEKKIRRKAQWDSLC